jgi:Mg/Co/Ni transporter MgtE
MTYDRDHDDDVYVEREGTGVGTILGVILAIVVVLAIIWFFFLGGMNGGTTTPNTDNTNQTQIEQPADGGAPGGAAPAY